MEILKEVHREFNEDSNGACTMIGNLCGVPTETNCIVGVDEAGRGPVLGAMVYSGFYAAVEESKGDNKSYKTVLETLKELNDSKQLTAKTREELFTNFGSMEGTGFALRVISPNEISTKKYCKGSQTLNDVSHYAAMDVIRALLKRNVKICHVFVDTVGPPEKYQRKLENEFPGIKFTVDKKADSKYKVVSAASICAKVTRDYLIQNWKFQYPQSIQMVDECGSGYPGDEVTKRFLRANMDFIFGFPNIVRHTWSTAEKILSNGVHISWGELEGEEKKHDQGLKKFLGKRRSDGTFKRKEKPILPTVTGIFEHFKIRRMESVKELSAYFTAANRKH